MKSVIIAIAIFLTSVNAFGQKSDLDLVKEYMAFQKSHVDSLTRETYIDAPFCKKYNLKDDTRSFKRIVTWQHPNGHDSKNFIKVLDVRWRFKDNAEAIAFHKKYLGVNSEYGEEIESPNIDVQHVEDLHVFRENVGARQMSADFGYPVNTFYFLFVVDNYVAKVFVNTKTSVTMEEASVFAKEAANKLLSRKRT